MSSENIIIKDPLYKQILIPNEFKKIIDSPAFQRLRYIKQTSFTDYVYPNANHTRFSHSIGTMHLMRKVLQNGLMNVKTKEKNDLLLAALLHDIGHGPFSHLWEKVFPHFDHEKSTISILEKLKLKNVAKIIEKKSKYSQLLSSTIDVDKLDYMARDSYFAGVSYGVAEVDFIIQHIFIKDNKLCIKPSALSSVEDLITQRVNLFKTVYYHKLAIMQDMIFINIFERVKELLKENEEIYIDKHLKNFFDKKDNINDLLALNDSIIIYHITLWQEHKDKILSDLCKRFILRDKLKVINTKHKNIEKEYKKIEKKVNKKYNSKYYFKYVTIPINILQTKIYVEYENKLKKIEEVSDLIKFYKTQKWNAEFLIAPKDCF